MSNKHFCTKHQEYHPIDEFALTKYNKPKSWCRAAYKEDAAERYASKGKAQREASRSTRMIQCQGKCGKLLPLTEFDKFNAKTCIACSQICVEANCNKSRAQRWDRDGLDRFCEEHRLQWKRERNELSYERHKDKRREEKRLDRILRPEILREQKKASDERRKLDPVRMAAHRKAQQVHQQNRRARELNAPGEHTIQQWLDKLEYYSYCCYICGDQLDPNVKGSITQEHIIPIVLGGSNWISNIKPACSDCNSHKWAKPPVLNKKFWDYSDAGDQDARALADRHYSRQTHGAKGFTQPGKSLVLKTSTNDALWVSMWPKPEYVKHAWPESWFCQIFRNEGGVLSSKLVKEAVALTRYQWNFIPKDGFITFINKDRVRHKRDPGRCFRKAGFEPVGYTAGGLIVLQLRPEDFPLPRK